MKKRVLWLMLFIVGIFMCACGTEVQESGSLKIYVDGMGIEDAYAMESAFKELYPEVEIEVEKLPQVRITYDSDGMPKVDTEELAERESVLQQHRTAIMAGRSDADLYLITGGGSQYHELNGGALIQNPYDLMSNGVLADMSALSDKIKPEDYLAGILEAGQMDGKQYLVPLQVSVYGFIVNKDSALEFEKKDSRKEQLDNLLTNYYQELSNLNGLCNQTVFSYSYPVVDKEKNEIYLYDENYKEAFAMAEAFYEQVQTYPMGDAYFGERISRGDTLIGGVSSPVTTYSAISADLLRYNFKANLEFVPFLNEADGVTAEAAVYAFAPASSENTDTAVLFLEWLLGEEVQGGNIPVFSTVYYPVRKGCAKSVLQNKFRIDAEYIGESALESLDVFETMVSDVKLTTRYDFELLNGMLEWQSGEIELDTMQKNLYEEWSLYLDE